MDFTNFLIMVMLFATTSQARKRPNGKGRVRNRELQDATMNTCDLEVSCKTDNGIPVKLPIRGPRGPPGPEGKKGEPGTTGTPGIPGMPGQSSSATRVAFFVALKHNLGYTDKDKTVAFDAVTTNVGNAYSVETGKFTAPVNGTYHFTVVISAQGGQRAAVYLVKAGTMVFTVWSESIPTWGTATNSAILQLQAGEQVWMLQAKRAPYLHGYRYSTFSGMLLFSDETKDVVSYL